MIEKCWEYLEAISMTVKPELQQWLLDVLDTRSCLGYVTVYKGLKKDHIYSERLPYGSIARNSKMHTVNFSDLSGVDKLWDLDDFVAYSALAYEAILRKSFN